MAQSVVIGVREQIAQILRSEIISGELAPNQKLTEEVLAQRFGVSRGRIRDVLLELSKEGLLVTRANKSTTVNDVAPPDLQALMVKLRLTIETFAINKVAKAPSEVLLSALEEALDKLSQCLKSDDFAEITKADIEFHRVIISAAGGEDLLTLWQPVIMRMRMNYRRLSTPAQSIEEHDAIFEAIKRGDAKGAVDALKANIR
ncbi:GntR family transcriptional regulator [Tsuneonella mangrovi]|uniref:GntR family transcriptional regulator n=1 Tax=Tsuneonella mangrovi TaxID=1982042 RepID=UPI000BA241D1|nr:GntR family transcriptional regulator [Tsuneonella mangrovi]